MLCKLGYALEFHWVGKTSPNQSAVYKINCSDCHASHIGETGRNLTTRLTEHKQSQIVTTTDTSLSQDFTHPDDQTTLLHVTSVFKPFTMCNISINTNKVSFFKYNIRVSGTIQPWTTSTPSSESCTHHQSMLALLFHPRGFPCKIIFKLCSHNSN